MKYPQPHRKMYLAMKRGKGIVLTAMDLQNLFRDDAMMTAATQKEADFRKVLKPSKMSNPIIWQIQGH